MLKKTHLAITVAAMLYFLPYVTHKLIFIPVLFLASFFPDIDSGFSFFGKKAITKPIQEFTNHRGMFHSYTICILLSLIIAYFYPIAALPFFLGYSFHLLADSFTVRGIRPLWPFKFQSAGKIRTGGKSEDIVFWVIVIIDAFLIVFSFRNF